MDEEGRAGLASTIGHPDHGSLATAQGQLSGLGAAHLGCLSLVAPSTTVCGMGMSLAFAEMGLPGLPYLLSGPGCSEAEGEGWCPGLIWGLGEEGTRGRKPGLPLGALWLQKPKETEDRRGCWVQAGGAWRSSSVSCRPGAGGEDLQTRCSVSLSFSCATKDITGAARGSSGRSLQPVHASPPSRVAGRASAWTCTAPTLEGVSWSNDEFPPNTDMKPRYKKLCVDIP